MTTQDQQALDWAKANPTDPRAKHIQAKVWANENPTDPRSSQVLDQVSKAQASMPSPQGNAFNVSVTQDKDANAEAEAKKLNDADLAKFKNDIQITPDTVNQIGANSLLPGAAGLLTKGMGALGRIGVGAMMGATQGAVKPGGDTSANALGGAAIGTLAGASMEGLRGLMGGLKGAASNVSRAYQLSQGSPEIQSEAAKNLQGAKEGLDYLGNGKLSDYLSSKSDSPISALTSNNPDDLAKLKSISDITGHDLMGMGSDLKSAVQTADAPLTKGVKQTLKQGAKGALSTITQPASGPLSDPRTLSAILNLIGK